MKTLIESTVYMQHYSDKNLRELMTEFDLLLELLHSFKTVFEARDAYASGYFHQDRFDHFHIYLGGSHIAIHQKKPWLDSRKQIISNRLIFATE